MLISFPRSWIAIGPDTLRLGCGATGVGRLGVDGTLLSLLSLNLKRSGVSGVCRLSPSDTPLSRRGSVLILIRGGDSCARVPWPMSERERGPCPRSDPPAGAGGCGSCGLDCCEFEFELDVETIISSAAVRLCGCAERYSMYDEDLERDRLKVLSSTLVFCGLSFFDTPSRDAVIGVEVGVLRLRAEGPAEASEWYGEPGMGVSGCPRSNASGPLCEPELCCAGWSELLRLDRFPDDPFRPDGEPGLEETCCERPGELRVEDWERRLWSAGLPFWCACPPPSLSFTYERERRYGVRSAPWDFGTGLSSPTMEVRFVMDSRRARAVFWRIPRGITKTSVGRSQTVSPDFVW